MKLTCFYNHKINFFLLPGEVPDSEGTWHDRKSIGQSDHSWQNENQINR